MKKFLSTLIIGVFFLIGAIAHAEIKPYEGVGEYYMSDFETFEVAQQRAKQRAEQNACEQAGVYVKSFSRTKNFELDENIIETMTSGILKILDVQYHRENFDNNTTLIRATIKAQIDSNDVLKWLNKNDDEKSELVAQMEALRKANAEQERQIAELKKQLAEVKTSQDKERITQAFAEEDKIFLSNQKVEEAMKFREKGSYDEAIKLLKEALELNPNNDDAKYWLANVYSLRAYDYWESEKYEQAIQDLTESLKLEPDDYHYFIRGRLYIANKQYKQAIQDFDKLIRSEPDEDLYMARGMAYGGLKQYEQAIQDLNKSIELRDDNYGAYLVRGSIYFLLKEYERAIQDLDRALEDFNNGYGYNRDNYNLNNYPKMKFDVVSLFSIRGLCYQQIDDKEKARADFAKVKELDPEGKTVSKTVELIYDQLGNNKKTRSLLNKAKKLGFNG